MQVAFDKALKDGQLIPSVTIMRILPPTGYSNPGGGSLTPINSAILCYGGRRSRESWFTRVLLGQYHNAGNQQTTGLRRNRVEVKTMSKAVQEHSPQRRECLRSGGTQMQIAIVEVPRHRNEIAGLEKKGLLQWLCLLPPIRLNLFSAYGFPRPSCQIGEYVALRGNTFALACVPT